MYDLYEKVLIYEKKKISHQKSKKERRENDDTVHYDSGFTTS